MLQVVVSVLLAAPFSVAVAPLAGSSKDLPTAELDALVTQALERAKAADKVALAAPDVAEVLVQPTLERLTTGKVRVTWLLVLRGTTQRDKVAFDFARPSFGPSGTQAMVEGMLTRALKLKQGGAAAVSSSSPTSSGRQAFDIDEVNRKSAEQGETADLGIKESTRPDSQGFRMGIGGGVGVFFPGPLVGPHGELRPGYQINDLMGVYASVALLGAFGFGGNIAPSARSANVSVGAVGWYGFGAVFELILDHRYFFAAGVHALGHAWATAGLGADTGGTVSQETVTSAGFVPGVSAKFGLGLGQPNAQTGRRHQFSMSIDVMTVFALNAVTVRQGVSGTDLMQGVSVTGLRVGLAPMVTLGWDFR